MYRDIIKIKEDVSTDVLAELRNMCIDAHNNRAGEVKIKDISERHFVFEGEEENYGCLSLGFLSLKDIPLFVDNVLSWRWEDEEPDENCDLMVELFTPIYGV